MELQQIVGRYAEAIQHVDATVTSSRANCRTGVVYMPGFKSLDEEPAIDAIDDAWEHLHPGLPQERLTSDLYRPEVGAGRMFPVPEPYPPEFRRDVVAVARQGETPVAQVAKDFGITESCLRRWLKAAQVEDGDRPGITAKEFEELRELKKRNRVLAALARFAPGRRTSQSPSSRRCTARLFG